MSTGGVASSKLTKKAKVQLRNAHHIYQHTLGKVAKPLDERLGAKLYGNGAGLNKNLTGRLAEAKCRARTGSVDTDETGEEFAQELRTNGYAELGTPYDPKLIEQIRRRFSDILDEDEHTKVMHEDDPGNGERYRIGITELVDRIPEVTQLLSEQIRSILRAYYGSYFQVLSAEAYRTRHIPPEIMERTDIYSDHWHLDGKSPDHVKLFLALSETGETQGPLHLMPKEDCKTIANRFPHFDRHQHGKPGGVVDEVGDPVTLTGEPGTALMGNSQSCLHRAGVPAEGETRDLLQFYIAPATEPWPDEWSHEDHKYAYTGGLWRLVKY